VGSSAGASRGSGVVLAGLAGATLAAWIVSIDEMRGMDAGPGTGLGAFGWFLGVWVTMMAAMMLPSAAPVALLVARLRDGAAACLFVVGYLISWALYGLAAYGVYRALRAVAPSFVAWDARGPGVAGGALAAAGLYQLTPLKRSCLRHCRSPIGFLMRAHRGALGSVRAGAGHGAYCIGCCFGLMVALFALGVMSLVWMAAVAAAILVEKTLPGGQRAAVALAGVLVALGLWVAVRPASVPGLTQPHPMGTMHR
jgi:predicted metal-binding membrane protein